jgi:adenine specific DNA methylase Mod
MVPGRDRGARRVNRLLFGDNLPWLQDWSIFPNESVDLVYLDPPFNSNADYNLIFREASGKASPAQFHAFTDTWNWVDAEATYREFLKTCQLAEAVNTLEAFHATLKTSPMMAYLAMMAPRLVELWKVLKNTGSLYLHCDPTASHYLKMLLDSIFGPTNFRNEIVWQRTEPIVTPTAGGGSAIPCCSTPRPTPTPGTLSTPRMTRSTSGSGTTTETRNQSASSGRTP